MSLRKKGWIWKTAIEPLESRELLTLALAAANIVATTEPFSGTVATLVDTNLADTPASFSSIRINWGDGSAVDTQSGHVARTLIPGVFEVDGTHTFVQNGALTTQITVVSNDGQVAQANGTASVPGPPLTISGNAVSGVAGTALSASTYPQDPHKVPVATFIDPDTTATAEEFNALIVWGDGHSSPGFVVGEKGAFSVLGDNTYATAGSYTFTVTVVGNGSTASTTGQATITSTSKSAALTPLQIVQPAGQALVNVPVATFTSATGSPAPSPSLFSAFIDWGDGHTGTGQVVAASGGLTILGSYTYALPGTYKITVSLQNQSGQSFTTTSTGDITNTDAVGNSFGFTIGLAPIPSNGPNASKGLTNTNRPTFSGTAAPFAIVQLAANRIDIDATLALGQAVADGSGHWSLATGPLSDGIYNVTATVTAPGSSPVLATNPSGSSNPLDEFIVDTLAPRVVAVTPLGGSGQVLVTMSAGSSGLNLADLLDRSNYVFNGSNGLQIHPSSVTAEFTGKLPTDPQSVILSLGKGSKIRRLVHGLSINASGITDRAGNVLLIPNDSFSLTRSPTHHVKITIRSQSRPTHRASHR